MNRQQRLDKISKLIDKVGDDLDALKQATNPALYAEECRRKSHNTRSTKRRKVSKE